MNIYRQGDVLILRRDGLTPGEPIPREAGRVVLAHGEVTGHAHAIPSKRAKMYALPGTADRFLRITGKQIVALIHEEHSPIYLPPGDYVVRRQREYTPEALRVVAD